MASDGVQDQRLRRRHGTGTVARTKGTTMRRTTTTALVAGALVLVSAAPAAAAAPVRDSSRGTFLNLSSPGCMDGEEPCLGLFASESEGGGFVCVDVPDALGSSFGCTETGSEALTVTRATQTLRPTAVEVGRLECTSQEECQVVDTRTVVVSATAETTGRRVNRVFRSRERSPECRSSSSFRSRSAPVAGTLTIDGTAHSLTGEAGTSRSRFLLRGCDFPVL